MYDPKIERFCKVLLYFSSIGLATYLIILALRLMESLSGGFIFG